MPVPEPIDGRRGSVWFETTFLHGEGRPMRPIRRGAGRQGSCSLIGGRSQEGFGPRSIDTSVGRYRTKGRDRDRRGQGLDPRGWTSDRRRRNRRLEWRDDEGRSSRIVGVVAASYVANRRKKRWRWWKGRKHSQESDVLRAGVPTWRWTKVVSPTAWLVGCKCMRTPKKWWRRKRT